MVEFSTHSSGAKREKMHERYDLFPIEAIVAYCRVAEFGAIKYAPWNWSKGLPRMQFAASLIRHLWAYMRGQDIDPESGLSHTDHILWNAVGLSYHHDHNMEDDRRPPEGKELTHDQFADEFKSAQRFHDGGLVGLSKIDIIK